MSSVLVLGGCGFIGRNFVAFLKSKGVTKIRVCDKQLPDLAGLSAAEKALLKEDAAVEFKQANLANAASCDKAFADGPWEVVVNLAGETQYSQSDEVYKEQVVDLTTHATAAAKKAGGVKKWIEVSTGQVYDSGKKPSSETAKQKPWTKYAAAKLQAEAVVQASGIPYTVLRTAVVYGPADVRGITPRLICGITYTKTGEEMKFLWDTDMRVHTVHVRDVCAAIWHVANLDAATGEIYNVVDDGDTTQGSIASLLVALFGIKTGFMGTMKSKVATGVAMKKVADYANETHLEPWSALCKEKGITNTPLTPYLDQELLFNNALALDGAKLKATGFEYSEKAISEQLLREVLKYFQGNGAFPDF